MAAAIPDLIPLLTAAGAETAKKLDHDVVAYSRHTEETKKKKLGVDKKEETLTLGAKAWELILLVFAALGWEAINIFKDNTSVLTEVEGWIVGGLEGVAIAEAAGEAAKLPAPKGGALQILDAQLGLFFSQTMGAVNLAGSTGIEKLIEGLNKVKK